MLIGVCGGICAGKASVTDYLKYEHGFRSVSLSTGSVAPIQDQLAERLKKAGSLHQAVEDNLTFPTVEALLDFVTTRWRDRWIINGIWSETDLEALLRRPFFLLISVDAPISVRWARYKAKYDVYITPHFEAEADPYTSRFQDIEKATLPTLEEFVQHNDDQLYNPKNGLAHLIDRAQVRLLNSSNSLPRLYEALNALKLTDEARMRPNWDQYFMRLASLAAQRSNCMKRRVGCVLVREKRVISTGYNGTPKNIRNCNEGGCPRCNGGQGAGVGLSTCLCLHAEENALLEAGRERIREGAILYCDTCPCLTCCIKITQVGISEVVYSQTYSMDTETAAIFKESSITLRQFVPPRNGLVDLSDAS